MNNNNLTFFINRSSLLEKLLIDYGFVKEKNKFSKALFSYYDFLDNTKIRSEYQVISRDITNEFDNKKTMYQKIIKTQYNYFLPETFTDINLWKNKVESKIYYLKNKVESKIYYLKNIYSTGGQDIYLIKNKDCLKKINFENPDDWIIQEDVNNLILYNGKKLTLRIYVVVTENKEFFLYQEGLGIIHKNKYNTNSNNYDVQINHHDINFIRVSKLDYYSKIIDQIKDIVFLSLQPFFVGKKLNKSYQILGYDFLIKENFKPILIEINAYPYLDYTDNLEKEIKTELLNDFIKLYIYPNILNKNRQTKNWILCNPIYHTDWMHRQLEVHFDNNLFLSEKYQINNHSKIICLRYFQDKCNCYNLKSNNLYRYMNKDFIDSFGCKLPLSKLIYQLDFTNFYPKTYFHINQLSDNQKTYFLKFSTYGGQNGVFKGNLSYLKNIIESGKYNDNYIIQEKVKNPITYKNNNITFGVWFVLFKDKYYLYKKTTEIAVEDNYDNHRINLNYNTCRLEDLKNYQKILKNIMIISEQFLDKLMKYMTNFNITKNEICLSRFDFMVTENYKPYILEINSCQIDLYGRQSFKDKLYCKDLQNEIFEFLYPK